MKVTNSHRVLVAGLIAVLLLGLTYFLFNRLQSGGSWDGPTLMLDAAHPPLIQFEKLSIHDPGIHRVLLRVSGTVPPQLSDHLGEIVSIKGWALERNPVPFVDVWEHEPVIEVRIPLVHKGTVSAGIDPGGETEPLMLHVAPLEQTFELQREAIQSPRLRIRDIAVDAEENSVYMMLANPSDNALTFDALYLNGWPVHQVSPITIPAHKQVRLWIRDPVGLDSASSVSLVIEHDGRWLQAAEVAASPPFFINEWNEPGEKGLHFDPTGVLRRHGGIVVDIEDDYPTADRQNGVPLGSHLRLMHEKLLNIRRQDSQLVGYSDPGGYRKAKSRTFALLGEGYRPASHYVYGRLTDFVGVKGFDLQLHNGTPGDVFYWIKTDRTIVEPRHVLAIPGVFSYKGKPAGKLDAVELKRLVLTMLAVAPRGLLYYQGADTEELYGFRSDPDLKKAVETVNRQISALAADLRYAVPVNWVYRESEGQSALDTSGRTGVFTLFSGSGRLIIISLGYQEEGWIKLPDGISLSRNTAHLLGGHTDRIEFPGVDSTAPLHPTVEVRDLTVDYHSDNSLSWILF